GGVARGGRSGARAAGDGCRWCGAGPSGAGAAGIGVAARKRNWCPGAASFRSSQSMGAWPSASSAPMSQYQPSRPASPALWRSSVMGAIYASRPPFAAKPCARKRPTLTRRAASTYRTSTDGLGKMPMALADAQSSPREVMEFDVVIVGAGPAVLAAAIRLKQLAGNAERDLSVVVLEKGSEVGAHILSGAVIDPIGLNALVPDWRAKGAPVETAVTDDRFYYLGPAGRLRIPNIVMPPLMRNHGNYIVSLGNLCRWLGEQATELGVDIYPGFAAAEVLYDDRGAVTGVATGDMGVGRDGEPTARFSRGMELKGKYTIVAEGARGSLTKTLTAKFGL